MLRAWRAAAMISVALLPVSAAWAVDMIDPSVSEQGISEVDIAIGRGDAPAVGASGLKLFPQPLPGTAAARDIGDSDGIALRREFTFLSDIEVSSLPELVAASRNDTDHFSGADDAGAAVNEWTGQLETDEVPALAPPIVKQAPPAPGRSPSGMGSP